MVSIEGRVVAVTGAGRGIGRAIAVELASRGCRLSLAARSRTELDHVAGQIGGASVYPTDVRERDQVHAFLAQTASTLGPIDVLVNAAGIGAYGSVVGFSDDDFEAVMQTNLRGTFFTSRFVLPSMIERNTGHIINIASIAGKVGTANRAVYCASKFAVVGFSQALAEEVREHGTRVSVICPGSTDTGFSDGPKAGKSRARMLQPADVARAVHMLVTQESNSFVSEIIMRPTQKP